MTYKLTFLTLICGVTLSGCQTLNGLKSDLGTLSNATSEKIASLRTKDESTKQSVVLGDSNCPAIIIDPQLDSISEFEDMTKTDENLLVSRAALSQTKSSCEFTDTTVDMQLDLTVTSQLGPKAKRTEKDRPYFAYPYFISITDSEGTELAKEIFAASVSFETDQTTLELVETINQSLPLNEDGTMPDYQINIGFQLTDEQLFYNASEK